ncbi:hypothetical protein [Methylocystis parvus]|uniref:XRE family transcriptional regulator n=1 Tax=Methylocystis parvus TaxID=134 RepID=A0A6B8M920_9HYPH|nr:hypothetical protein [Methylocystis parvus]QGM98129.1 hypothetical protein F7D14_12000 [Methylocystis parvus]WBK01550.1 hypothetical protein MMG94_07570 [Methylocystis parvus OBBP]
MTVAPSHEQFFLASGHLADADPAAAERLVRAREIAGYATPGAAVAYRRWSLKDYLDHESGKRAITPDDARRYAKGYRVSARWILMGA